MISLRALFTKKKYWSMDLNISDHYCPVKAGKSVFEIVET